MFLTLEFFCDLVTCSFGFTNLLLKIFNYTKIKFTSTASHCHLSLSSSLVSASHCHLSLSSSISLSQQTSSKKTAGGILNLATMQQLVCFVFLWRNDQISSENSKNSNNIPIF